MEPIAVLVTGVGGGGHGEQILKALRLAATPYRIVGTDVSRCSKGLVDADAAELLPPASDPAYLAALFEVCARYGVVAVFHGSEPELKVMSAHRGEFARRNLFLPINPTFVIDTCMDKVKTAEFLRTAGFRAPSFLRVTSRSELESFDRLPAVIKPSVGGGGSANMFLAQTGEELRIFGEHLLSIYPEFIVQEYVGTPDGEYTVGVLSSMDGELLNSIAVRRNILSSLSNRVRIPNRTGRAELGPVLALSNGVSQGEIGRFPEVTAECERIARALGSRGPINVQCRLVGSDVCVFEINPRFSGTTSLRAMVGYNEPDVLIRKHLLKEPIEPHFPYRSGVILRGLAETLLDPDDLPKRQRATGDPRSGAP